MVSYVVEYGSMTPCTRDDSGDHEKWRNHIEHPCIDFSWKRDYRDGVFAWLEHSQNQPNDDTKSERNNFQNKQFVALLLGLRRLKQAITDWRLVNVCMYVVCSLFHCLCHLILSSNVRKVL